MKTSFFSKAASTALIMFLAWYSLAGQDTRPGIECGCDKYGDYVPPAVKAILVEDSEVIKEGYSASKDPEYMVFHESAPPPDVVSLSVYRGSNLIFHNSSNAVGWGFSPDQDRFAMYGFTQDRKFWWKLVDLDPDPSEEGEPVVEYEAVITSLNATSASMAFSPHGRYIVTTSIMEMEGRMLLDIYDYRTLEKVFSYNTTNMVAPVIKKGSAGWGFSPDAEDASFVFAFLTGVNQYAFYGVNLEKQTDQLIAEVPSSDNTLGFATFSFSPCGDYLAWRYENMSSAPTCRIYKTNAADTFEEISAEGLAKIYTAEDGHYAKYLSGSPQPITDNTADEDCPDKQKPEWTDAVLTATLIQGVRVELEWDGDSDGDNAVTQYLIEIYETFGELLKYYRYKVSNEDSPVKSFAVTGLQPERSYRFRVEAGDKAGNWSTDGPEETFTTLSDSPPEWPLNSSFQSGSATETSVKFSWDHPAEDDFGVVSYMVRTTGLDTLCIVGPDSVQCRARGLVAGTEYDLNLYAIDEAGNMSSSLQCELTMPAPAKPFWPENATLTCSDSTETSLWVNWPEAQDAFNAVEYYRVSMDDAPAQEVDRYARKLQFRDLEEGGSYNFTVIAYDESDNPSDPLEGQLSTIPAFIRDTLVSGPGNQKMPDIDGNLVVWMDDSNNEGDIWSLDIETGTKSRITDDDHLQYEPAVSDGRVVWTDNRNGDMDIFMSDTNGVVVPVCVAEGDQDLPAIDGNLVVWRDSRNGNFDLYMYDIGEKKEYPLLTRSSNQNWPDVSGGFIVYADDRNDNWDIYMYNVYTKKEYPVCTHQADQKFPSVSGTSIASLAIAYMDHRNGHNLYIYYPDFYGGTSFEYLVPTDEQPVISVQAYPHLADNQLAYQDNYGSDDGNRWGVYAYRFLTNLPGSGDKKIAIGISPQANQTNPRTSGGNIVWEHELNGDCDIHIWRRPPGSNLSLEVSEESDPVAPFDTLEYAITLTNKGPEYNHEIITEIGLPMMVIYESSEAERGTVVLEGKNLRWSVDHLAPGEQISILVSVITLQESLLELHAVAYGTSFDPYPSDNEIMESTKVKNVIPVNVHSGNEPAMIAEGDGRVHLVYFNQDTLFYSVKERSSRKWNHYRLAYCPSSLNTDMTMAPDGTIHIVYSAYNFDWDAGAKGILFHGTLTSSQRWEKRIIEVSPVEYLNLKIKSTSTGDLYLGYIRGRFDGQAMIKKQENGLWQEAKTAYPSAQWCMDMHVDALDKLHLSFYDLQNGGIRYMLWSDTGAPVSEQVEPDWSGGQMEALVTSVTTDTLNRPVISYAGSVANDHLEHIKYALREGDTWKVFKIDEGASISTSNRIIIMKSGTPVAGYIHHLTGQLRYSLNPYGTWIRQNVSDSPVWVRDLEMDLDQEGYAHMALPGVTYLLIPPPALIDTDPDSLDFGVVEKNMEKTLAIKIFNPSMKETIVDSIRIDDPRFTVDMENFILPGYGETMINVKFSQSEETGASTRLRIYYNGVAGMMAEIPVKARRSGPALASDPVVLTFTNVQEEELVSKTLLLKNIGNSDLEISGIILRSKMMYGMPVPHDFKLSGDEGCTMIPPDGSCELTITFQPGIESSESSQVVYLDISSNDSEDPVKTITVSGNMAVPSIYIPDATVDFGYAATGQSVTRNLTIRNWGGKELNITGITLSDASQFTFSSVCSTIPAGGSCDLPVTMTPNVAGDLTATMTINSDSYSFYTKSVKVTLKGTSLLRTLEVTPAVIDFGEAGIGDVVTRTITLSNTGQNPVSVSGAYTYGASASEFGCADAGACSIIAAGGSCDLGVSFRPLYGGNKQAELAIHSDDSNHPEQYITLNGTAADPDPLSVSVTAEPQSGQDTLVVTFTPALAGGQPPMTWSWDFDDLTGSTEPNPTHEFKCPGSYLVRLQVTDIMGESATATAEVLVTTEGAPLVSIEANPSSGEVPLTIQFTASVAGGEVPMTYAWDFGDGGTGSGQSTSHTYNTPGSFTVKVTVTDAGSHTATDALPVTAISAVSISGSLWNQEGTANIDKAEVLLLKIGDLQEKSSINLDGSHSYSFQGLEPSSYTVLAIADPVSYSGYLPTYLGDKLTLFEALFESLSGHVTGKDIRIVNTPAAGTGTGSILGTLTEDTGKGVTVTVGTRKTSGNPIPGTYVYLRDNAGGELKGWDITATDGTFEFLNLNNGTYKFIADYLGRPMDANNSPLVISDARKDIEITATAGQDRISVTELATLSGNLIYDELRLYPVPARDLIILEVPEGLFREGSLTIGLIDLSGRCISLQKAGDLKDNRMCINLSGLPAGIYFLTLSDGYDCRRLKIVRMD